MQLPICALFAWFTIALFCLIPKRLAVFDLVFMYMVTLIMTTIVFTLFDLTMHTVIIPRTVTTSFAVIMCRLVTIPLLIMMAVNALLSVVHKKARFAAAIVIWLAVVVFDWMLNLLHVIVYQKSLMWHVVSTLCVYFAFITVTYWLTRIYMRMDRSNLWQT